MLRTNATNLQTALVFLRGAALAPADRMKRNFNRLLTRAVDPNMIPGIYDYCDGRCARCPFTARCLSFFDSRDLESQHDEQPPAATLERSLRRMIEFLNDVAVREGFDLSTALAEPRALDDDDDRDGQDDDDRNDPLVVSAREYADMTHPVMRALEPVLARRGDSALIDATDTITWFSTTLAPKIGRAIASGADGWEHSNDVQSDANGSAKVARLAIAESERAWRVLMEAGRATADGVPARAVAMLSEIDAGLAARFPMAMDFVRPGFDEPHRTSGAPPASAADESRGQP